MQVKLKNVRDTQDLENMIISANDIFNNGNLVTATRNIAAILSTAEQTEQRELKKRFLI